jgi:hypothetical protein
LDCERFAQVNSVFVARVGMASCSFLIHKGLDGKARPSAPLTVKMFVSSLEAEGRLALIEIVGKWTTVRRVC